MNELKKIQNEQSNEVEFSIFENSTSSIKWISITIFTLWITGTFIILKRPMVQLVAIFCIIPQLIALNILSFQLLSKARNLLLSKTFIAGCIFMVGGAFFDIAATIYHTPDLKREANPIVRFLFSNGFSISFIYIYGIIAQFLTILWSGFLWAAFIRHRTLWLNTVMLLKPKSFSAFIRFSFSGKPLGIIDFLIPFGKGRSKKISFIFWIIIPTVVGIYLHRWLLGFHWFKLLTDIPKYEGGIFGIIIAYVIFFIWLFLEYKKRLLGSD